MPQTATYTQILTRRAHVYDLPSGLRVRLSKPKGMAAMRALPRVQELLGPLFMAVLTGKIQRPDGEAVRLAECVGHSAPPDLSDLLMEYISEDLSRRGPVAMAMLSSPDFDPESDAADATLLAQLVRMLREIDVESCIAVVCDLFAGRGALVEPAELGDGAATFEFPDSPEDLREMIEESADLHDLSALVACALEYTYRPT